MKLLLPLKAEKFNLSICLILIPKMAHKNMAEWPINI